MFEDIYVICSLLPKDSAHHFQLILTFKRDSTQDGTRSVPVIFRFRTKTSFSLCLSNDYDEFKHKVKVALGYEDVDDSLINVSVVR